MFGYLLVPNAPISLIGIVILISFVPILVLLPPFLERRFRLMLYFLVGFSAFNALVTWIPVNPTFKRELHFLGHCTLFFFFAYVLPPFSAARTKGVSLVRRLVLLGIWLAVAALGVALFADFFGYVRLSQFLAAACLYSAFIAISAFTALASLQSPVPCGNRLARSRADRRGATASLHNHALGTSHRGMGWCLHLADCDA